MYDLSNPSPFVLTHFECIATVAGFCAVVFAVAVDVWRGRRLHHNGHSEGRQPR